jgi:hypothetical protein
MRHFNLTQNSNDDDEGAAKINSWADLLMEQKIPIEMLDQCLKHVIANRHGERFPVAITEMLQAHTELTANRIDLSKMWQCTFCEWVYKNHAGMSCPFHSNVTATISSGSER